MGDKRGQTLRMLLLVAYIFYTILGGGSDHHTSECHGSLPLHHRVSTKSTTTKQKTV